MKKKFHFKLSTTQTTMLSFFLAILVGSVLLALPISSANGEAVPYIDALFTATTAICVTGLVTLPTVSTWSLFGQVVILILIQIGGLGVITIMSGLMISLHRKIGIKDRMLIQDAFNLNTSISAFCNAGIDIISENSLCDYALNPMINIVTSALIILGGIGYIVWWDVIRALKDIRNKKLKFFSNLTLHSKIALSATGVLIVVGAVFFFIFEYNNPLTMKDYSLFDKIQASLFQSVTTRTAGFATIPQQNLTNASATVSLLLMFIGGSPVGTAGGIKTVTIAVLIFAAFSTINNKEDVVLFQRTIPKQAVSKAVAVVCMSFMIMFISTLLLSAVTNANALDIAYETVSATATVGLTRNLTPILNIWGKLIIIVTMYLGRVGPISLVIAFNTTKEKKNIIKEPTEEISIG